MILSQTTSSWAHLRYLKNISKLNISKLNSQSFHTYVGCEWSYERDKILKHKLHQQLTEIKARKERVQRTAQKFSPQAKEKLKSLKMEILVLQSQGYQVPSFEEVKDNEWWEILERSQNQRIKIYEKIKRNLDTVRDFEWAGEIQDTMADTSSPYLYLNGNDKPRLDKLFALRHLTTKQFGIPLVIDFDQASLMSLPNINNLQLQIKQLLTLNQTSPDPFNIVFANARFREAFACGYLTDKGAIDRLLVDWTDQCFTKVFPKENLVYLHSHAETTLTHFNPQEVYIVSALQPVKPYYIEQKAKSLGIRTAMLPLSREERMNYKSWLLDVHHLVELLHEVKQHGSWIKAIEHINRSSLKASPSI